MTLSRVPAPRPHAVLEANKRDEGNRRVILVEMEGYADKLTAERVRRVINGYDFTGTQRTELLREKLSWSKLQKADKLTEQVEKIENLHGHEFDAIKKTVKDGELVVTGETRVEDRAEGLGGNFTYCTLGEPVELDHILTGEDLPTFDALAGVLFHMTTSQPLDPAHMDEANAYVGRGRWHPCLADLSPQSGLAQIARSGVDTHFRAAIGRSQARRAPPCLCPRALCFAKALGCRRLAR